MSWNKGNIAGKLAVSPNGVTSFENTDFLKHGTEQVVDIIQVMLGLMLPITNPPHHHLKSKKVVKNIDILLYTF